MKAALFSGAGKPIDIADVPTPEPQGRQVLVRIAGSGACHSDLHLIHGAMPFAGPPKILGHENAGYVEDIGPEATGVSRGDPVAVYGGWGCGACRRCLAGDEQLCGVMQWAGIGPPGGYAEYLLVPDPRHLVPLGDLDPVEAAPLTDAALTPYRAIKRMATRLHGGSTALAIGIGGLGQFGVEILRAMTATRVVAADVSDAKLEIASSLGADATVRSDQGGAAGVRDATEGRGADVVLDFVGSDETLELALASVAPQGAIVVIGIGGGSVTFSAAGLSEVSITSSAWGNPTELREVIDMARRGRIRARVERFPLAAINDVFARLDRGDIAGRAVLTP